MRTEILALVGVGLVGVVGCGTSTEPTDEPATSTDVATYELLVAQVRTGATSYHATMMGDPMDPAVCATVHDAYHQHQSETLAEMMHLAGPMDGLMANHGGMMDADNRCLVGGMMDELDRHHAQACLAGDWAGNRDEAARHSDAMIDYAGLVAERCEEMMAGISTGEWHFGPMMDGCGAWSDQCRDGAHGGMMHCM